MCRHIHYRISPVSSKTFRMLGADTYTRTSCRNTRTMQYVAVCCSVLQCVAVCCSVLQCVAVMPYVQTHTLAHLVETHARYSMLQCVAACCDVLRCVAMCCSVLQCVAVSRSVLQCVAVTPYVQIYKMPPMCRKRPLSANHTWMTGLLRMKVSFRT